jgi:ABC-type nickel/cobalt efflux system permease component RcnA
MQRISRLASKLALVVVALAAGAPAAAAHPLGNFTVNRFVRLEVGAERIQVRYVIDMAEIAAFQELLRADADGSGETSEAELEGHARRAAASYAENFDLALDGVRPGLGLERLVVSLPPGAGGLSTLRLEATYSAPAPGGTFAGRVTFEDRNEPDRLGWREIVVAGKPGIAVFDSTAYGNGITDELRAYPDDLLSAPLGERTAAFSFAAGSAPAGAAPLRSRDNRPVVAARDRLAELVAVEEVTLPVALLGLLVAASLGAAHAMSPGHGKTVVGAYLIGTRGTAWHAAFLGLTVTITHTAGVFALGLATLFASRYVLPERLLPILAVVSGVVVVAVGLKLLAGRLRTATGPGSHGSHAHSQSHHADGHAHGHDHEHAHDHGHLDESHSHGGAAHSHLPPGADGKRVTWRGLLALGISGGLLPCPSALVVLLSAIALNRVGYGLLLVIAFSLGLAGALTAVGLAFVYAGRLMKTLPAGGRLLRLAPVGSALVITCIGLAICYDALMQAGLIANASAFAAGFASMNSAEEPSLAGLGMLGVLSLGLLFGLKHAMEADHVVAVSTIVAECRSIGWAAAVGGLWGVGHTLSLIVVGAVVLALRVSIPGDVAQWLEFAVALMIILLGANVLGRAFRGRSDVHRHVHDHDGVEHVHVHFHDAAVDHSAAHAGRTHTVTRLGLKPVLVGAVHGLAGSAALTLLVLAQIQSVALGLLYLAVFGAGSIVGMLLMSGLVGLPFAFSSGRLNGFHRVLQVAAGGLSVAFGIWYAYAILSEVPAVAAGLGKL